MSRLRAIRETLQATAADGALSAFPLAANSQCDGLRLLMDHIDRLVLEQTMSVYFEDGTVLQFTAQHRRLVSWRTERSGTIDADMSPGRTSEPLKPDDAERVAKTLQTLCEQSSIVAVECNAISADVLPSTAGLAPAAILRRCGSEGALPHIASLQDRMTRLKSASDVDVKAAFLMIDGALSVLFKSPDAHAGLADHATSILDHVTADQFVLASTLETHGALSFQLSSPDALHVLVVGHIGSLGVVYCGGCSGSDPMKVWLATA